MTPPTRMLTAFMIVPPGLRPREVLGVVSPVTRGIDDEPREDCFPSVDTPLLARENFQDCVGA
jgi:hypothetical protein